MYLFSYNIALLHKVFNEEVALLVLGRYKVSEIFTQFYTKLINRQFGGKVNLLPILFHLPIYVGQIMHVFQPRMCTAFHFDVYLLVKSSSQQLGHGTLATICRLRNEVTLIIFSKILKRNYILVLITSPLHVLVDSRLHVLVGSYHIMSFHHNKTINFPQLY